MLHALIATATLAFSAADFPETPPCSEDAAAHVATNHHVCVWSPPPPMPLPGGGSDYALPGGYVSFDRYRPDFTWRLRNGELMRLDEIPASLLAEEKELLRSHSDACRTPGARARLGERVALMRSDRASDCWAFLDNQETRTNGERRPQRIEERDRRD